MSLHRPVIGSFSHLTSVTAHVTSGLPAVQANRHRYLACLAKQVPPRFRPYAGECGSPLAFVVTKNIHRRHLTETQRALVAAGLKPLFEEEARQRQRAALKQGSEPPVDENSRRREKHEKNGRSAQKAA